MSHNAAIFVLALGVTTMALGTILIVVAAVELTVARIASLPAALIAQEPTNV